ncbi:MAG: DUF362 domain-containing protein [Halobacteriota archaeon]
MQQELGIPPTPEGSYFSSPRILCGAMGYEVSVVKCGTYDDELVREAIEASLVPLGGLETVVSKGDRVLIKPNLLSARSPDRAVTTHPAIVKAVVELVQDCGVNPLVGDSPGGGSTSGSYRALLSRTGLQEVADVTGCELVRFDEEKVEVSSATAQVFKKFTLASAVTAADVIIGLPKLKTHSLTYYTGAVKLLFGCIPGMYKTEYHLHTAEDPYLFADFLLDLCETCRPAISIMDAIVGMEGSGPSNGSPRQIGLVAASKSSTALDYVAAKIVGFDPMNVPTIKRAYERNLGPKSLDEITVHGEKVDPLILHDFKKTVTTPFARVPPTILNKTKWLIGIRPRIDVERCRKCGQCAEACPPQAISFLKNHGPRVDYDRCIRCYCCQEMCPEGAVALSTPLIRRLIKR